MLRERLRASGHGRDTAAILVTGGAGYIGSHVVRLLREHNRDVVVLDRQSPRDPYLASLARFVVGDVRDTAVLRRVLGEHQIGAVVHIAGVKSVEESMRDPHAYFDINTVGSLRLLDAMREAGVRRMVFSSSAAIYGPPEDVPVTEDAPIRPMNPYGESKAAVERMLAWWERCHGIGSVSLRYFNAAGASVDARLGEDWTAATNLIPVVMQAVLGARSAVQIFGTDYPTPDGTPIRDYVHVLDLASAHLLAIDYLTEGGGSLAMNLGTGGGASVAEVIAAVERVAGRSVPVDPVGRRPGDPAAVWADVSRARQVLGWQPQYGLDDIVSSAWRWHARGERNVRVEGPSD